jgi:hypothetical protein
LPQITATLRDDARNHSWAIPTKDTYTSAFNSWIKYCQLRQMDVNCHSGDGLIWSGIKLEEFICDYVSVQCGIRGLAPQSVFKVYLPGIAYVLEMNRSDARFLFRECYVGREIKKCANGFFRLYNAKCSSAEKMKLPFGMDLALKSRKIMIAKAQFLEFGDDGAMLRYRIFVALCVGIYFMLRCSEHVWSKKATAVKLKRSMFTFFDTKGLPIPYAQIGLTSASSVAINVKYGKVDSKGQGRRNRHIKQPDSKVCIVSILEKYFSWTRDKYGASEDIGLYDVPLFKNLAKDDIQLVMQHTVDASGITNTRKLTSHCLRYGGATMLAAAGFPHYLIAYYGGWSPDSKSLKIYTRPSDDMQFLVSAHMAKMARKDSSLYFIQESHMINKSKK